MHVFRHDDVGPQVKAVFLTSDVNCVDEPESRSVPTQERPSVKAGKCQRASIVWVFVTTTMFPNGYHTVELDLALESFRNEFLAGAHGGNILPPALHLNVSAADDN